MITTWIFLEVESFRLKSSDEKKGNRNYTTIGGYRKPKFFFESLDVMKQQKKKILYTNKLCTLRLTFYTGQGVVSNFY